MECFWENPSAGGKTSPGLQGPATGPDAHRAAERHGVGGHSLVGLWCGAPRAVSQRQDHRDGEGEAFLVTKLPRGGSKILQKHQENQGKPCFFWCFVALNLVLVM